MKLNKRAKLATAIAGLAAVVSMLATQPKSNADIMKADADNNIIYVYEDTEGATVIGVQDTSQLTAVSAFQKRGGKVRYVQSSMYIAYDDETPPPIKRYLPVVMNGLLSWSASGDRSARYIPAPGGVSVGHPEITYGTIGDQVTYKGNPNCFITNAHVAGGLDGGKVGDRIVQPGVHHGGTETIGYIVAMVTPLKDVTNTVDAAIVCGERGSVYPGIYGIEGAVTGVYEDPYIGMQAVKCGATSGCTTLTLVATDITIKIGYAHGRQILMRTFSHQMMWSGDSSPGDSGSDIVADHKMAGLLFAGNEEENRVMSNDPEYLMMALPGLIP